MRSFSPALLFAAGALALNTPECFTEHGSGLAALSECAAHHILTACFADLEAFDKSDIESCLLTAGCPADDAPLEARAVLDRCHEWLVASDLRKRMPAAAVMAQPVQTTAAPQLFPRSSLDCLTERTYDTSSCDTVTVDGRPTTTNCQDTVGTESVCRPGLTCSLDRSGTQVCMELQDSLDTAGIVVSIVFGVMIAIAIGALTYFCCQDRRQQKRLAAKAEATALARAATKKQRSAEARAPLMSEQNPAQVAPGPGDPFSDRAHH
ncbi:hypothetical protein B0I35DRAFT_481797 [Stachybotrys elegans]|uniref:Extracellular membrane protein CFEM domain-containing protein n=1 Tax=Stachybotrys elegans TaxID=80388 RepID=A0A8K0SK30_9HYPO|nr:hypothetical protein B0I35DRAFT_481797 [Stachybotrys elegans]